MINFIKKHFIKKLWFWIVVVFLLAATLAIRSGWVGDMFDEEEVENTGNDGYDGYQN